MTMKLASACLLFACLSGAALADAPVPGQNIHTVTVIHGACDNLAISTKVGHLNNGQCTYEKETQSYNYSGCTQVLNGGLLEMNAGPGYTCGATVVHSNLFGGTAEDPFNLITDSNGGYLATVPAQGEVSLPK